MEPGPVNKFVIFFAWLGVFSVAVALVAAIYFRDAVIEAVFPKAISVQTKYLGVALLSTKAEVEYQKGIPDSSYSSGAVIDRESGHFDYEYRTLQGEVSQEDLPEHFFYDNRIWSYRIPTPAEMPELDFDAAEEFDFVEDGNSVVRITCYVFSELQHDVSNVCEPLYGISTGTPEAAVIGKLGEPTAQWLGEGRKGLIYFDLRCAFFLRRGEVYKIELFHMVE